jgi:hypothetical protein
VLVVGGGSRVKERGGAGLEQRAGRLGPPGPLRHLALAPPLGHDGVELVGSSAPFGLRALVGIPVHAASSLVSAAGTVQARRRCSGRAAPAVTTILARQVNEEEELEARRPLRSLCPLSMREERP